jgi:hypothetical protein
MTEQLDTAIRVAQKCLELQPVIIVGSGASVPYGLPTMAEIGSHLISSINPAEADKEIWEKVCNQLEEGGNLETVLDQLGPETQLLKSIISKTWAFINEKDQQVFSRLGSERDFFPLGKLLTRLTQTSGRRVDVVTTNYDRIIEYASENRDLVWFDGFGPGYRRSLWSEGMPVIKRSANAGVPAERTVAIWKVHGSLDWFIDSQGRALSTPLSKACPNDSLPSIITPGRTKYERTQYEPFRTILGEADAAMKRAGGVICIGYGFNDNHVQEKLRSRRDTPNFCFVVITRELTEAARRFLEGCKNFVAIEAYSESAGDEQKIFGNKSRVSMPGTEFVVERPIWNLGGFLNEVL